MNFRKTAHTPYARPWTRTATCTFMSKTPIAPIRGILANLQIFSELQNALSCILKQAVLAAETGHIAARNVRFHGAI